MGQCHLEPILSLRERSPPLPLPCPLTSVGACCRGLAALSPGRWPPRPPPCPPCVQPAWTLAIPQTHRLALLASGSLSLPCPSLAQLERAFGPVAADMALSPTLARGPRIVEGRHARASPRQRPQGDALPGHGWDSFPLRPRRPVQQAEGLPSPESTWNPASPSHYSCDLQPRLRAGGMLGTALA